MLDGLTEKIREIESGGRVLYRRDYRISSEKQMPNLLLIVCLSTPPASVSRRASSHDPKPRQL